jgi:chromate transporter
MVETTPTPNLTTARRLREVARIFLLLGVTAFGGPAAHIAMMREHLVRRRGWVTEDRFADLIGVVNLIPGPSSTELGIYLGYLRAGWLGLLVAGVCFIGPAMLLVLACAWAYVTFGALPAVGAIMQGIFPVVIAIIAQALIGLGRTILRGWLPALIGSAVVALYLLSANTIVLLFSAGILGGALIFLARLPAARLPCAFPGALALAAPTAGGLAIFLAFLKLGAVTYGSGYVLLAFLRAELVTHLHWVTERQLLDAVAVGQFTPGPVFTTATFLGYVIGGVPGAILATLGIFMPAFVFVPLIHPLARQVRRYRLTSALLDGVNAAALGLMAGVLAQLAHATFTGWLPVAEAVMALAILLRFQVNSAWLILAGALVGAATLLAR